MSKYTPGPWFYGVAYEPQRGPVPFNYRSPGYYENAGIIGANGATIVGCDEYDVFDNQADTRLMVAAPDMLEALHAVAAQPGFEPDEPYGKQVLAAIRTAEGAE
jgi:hypothetical protein